MEIFSSKKFIIQQILDWNKEYLLEEKIELLPFQKVDYQRAKEILKNFNGVMITSSVGLGKSYIACKLLADYLIYKEIKILLILPPGIIKQWEDYLREFQISPLDHRIDIISMYSFGISDFEINKHYDVVLIDEVHNFRNNTSNRYKNLIKIPKIGTKFILLTATPMNNSYIDIYNIISIFHDENQFKQNDIEAEYHQLSEFVKK